MNSHVSRMFKFSLGICLYKFYTFDQDNYNYVSFFIDEEGKIETRLKFHN